MTSSGLTREASGFGAVEGSAAIHEAFQPSAATLLIAATIAAMKTEAHFLVFMFSLT